jgi:hypothetical protein
MGRPSGSFSVLEFGAGSIFGFTSPPSLARAALLLVITELRKNRSRNVRGTNAFLGLGFTASPDDAGQTGSETGATWSNSCSWDEDGLGLR